VECDYRGWIGCCPQAPGWIRDAVEYVFRCFFADQDDRLIRDAVEYVFGYFVEHDHCRLNVNLDGLHDDDGLNDHGLNVYRPDDFRCFLHFYKQHGDAQSESEHRLACACHDVYVFDDGDIYL
jgi:hypothetical protein